jgi:hypothetical protein
MSEHIERRPNQHGVPRNQANLQALTRSPLTDSNRRPLPYHGSALPTELRGRWCQPIDSGDTGAGGSLRTRLAAATACAAPAGIRSASRLCRAVRAPSCGRHNGQLMAGIGHKPHEHCALGARVTASWLDHALPSLIIRSGRTLPAPSKASRIRRRALALSGCPYSSTTRRPPSR